jgi:hypothetical protein
MNLHPSDSTVQIVEHLGDTELRYGSGTDCENRVSLATENVKRLSALVITDLTPIGMPCPTYHVDDAQPVAVAFRGKHIHQQTDPMYLAVNDVFMLNVRRFFSGGRLEG